MDNQPSENDLTGGDAGQQHEDQNSTQAPTIEAQVKAAFDQWNDAWNRGDLGGYLEAYWDSPQTRYVSQSLKAVPFADGIVVHGKKNIDKVFTDVFVKSKTFLAKQANPKGVAGFLSLNCLDVTPAGLEDAIAFGEFNIDMTDTLTRAGHFTIHLRKIEVGWVIVSEHATALPKDDKVAEKNGRQCSIL